MIVSMEATPAWDFIPDKFPEAHHHHEPAFGTLSLASSLRPRRLRPLPAASAGTQDGRTLPVRICQLTNTTLAGSSTQPAQLARLQLWHTALAVSRFTCIGTPRRFSHRVLGAITLLAAVITNTPPYAVTTVTNQLLAAGIKAPKMFADTNDVAVATSNHAQQTPSLGMVLSPAQNRASTTSCGAVISGSLTTKNTIS